MTYDPDFEMYLKNGYFFVIVYTEDESPCDQIIIAKLHDICEVIVTHDLY